MLIITSKKVWETSDGATHTTHAMAVQHVCNAILVDLLVRDDRNAHEAQDLINNLSGYRKQLREWLDACDAMEKASLE